MGRKNEIEGQLNFLDMLAGGTAADEEQEMLEQETLDKKEVISAQGFPHDNEQTVAAKGGEKDKKWKPGGFAECIDCWCSTCEHSSVGGSVPRPFGENTRPCPSCELCVSEGKADVCVIGSADEGCRYRAEKDGLIS